jgi:hypothetical protein
MIEISLAKYIPTGWKIFEGLKSRRNESCKRAVFDVITRNMFPIWESEVIRRAVSYVPAEVQHALSVLNYESKISYWHGRWFVVGQMPSAPGWE